MRPGSDPATLWLNGRLAGSDLIRLFFALREDGLDPREGAQAVGSLTDLYVLGRCNRLATFAARRVGRDRLVGFHWPDGRLLHSVLACSPQEAGGPLKGDGVDILGRMSLRTLAEDLSRLVGGIQVEVGGLLDEDDFMEGEAAALERLCPHLPWLRRAMLLAEADDAAPAAFLQAAAWFRSAVEAVDGHGIGQAPASR
ncbi:hypothetical protein [Methylorubrum extorquens]|uniref:Uncharacterized protein n=1 Tax=Methylorubrum extorquens DSM 13060 TaxID=882800 RepID=H1KDH2_METEX|nr:hypothetical protein [Methylorubrum extorquens]EHP94485.1 hypothetical protein MetexDRAFT_0684 [Methylorubrum extorquens DSM 13060]